MNFFRRQPPAAADIDQLAQRIAALEQVDRTVQATLENRDQHIQHLHDILTELRGHLTSRWTFFQGLVSILGFLFAINFAYQIYRTTELMKLTDDARTAIKHHASLTREVSSEMNTLAGTLADFGGALSEIALAERFNRESRFGAASLAANKAVQLMRNRLVAIDTRIATTPADTQPVTTNLADDAAAPVTLNLTSEMRGPIESVLYSSLNVQARALFGLGDLGTLTMVADDMIELNPKRYGGHHWRGLAGLQKNLPIDLVIASFNESVSLQPHYNPDRMNMAELFFTKCDFANAQEHAARYLAEDPRAAPVLAMTGSFIRSMSEFMINANARTPLEKLQQEERRLKPEWEGQFGSEALVQLHRSIRAGQMLTEYPGRKRDEFLAALQWFIVTVDPKAQLDEPTQSTAQQTQDP